MEYDRMIRKVLELSFIKDQARAEAAVTTVLNLLVASAPEPERSRMTRNFPHPLTLAELSSGREELRRITRFQLDTETANKFNLTLEQAHEVVRAVAAAAQEVSGYPYDELDGLSA